MTKSEFYKIWYSTRLPGQCLQEDGYPNIVFKAKPIVTEEQWLEFLETEIELDEFVRLSPDAAAMMGQEYVMPYTRARVYPDQTEQLDGIFKSLLALKTAGISLGAEGDAYIASVKAVKDQFPKN
jgi:hypothetical protein